MADPGFPMGGGKDPLGEHGPSTQELFSENVCENERIGSPGGVRRKFLYVDPTPAILSVYTYNREGGDRLMFCAANMIFAEIFDDVFNFYVLIMICVININQITDHY